MKLTRRNLAAFVVTSAAAFAQTPSAIPANPDEELKAARDRFKSASDTLTKLTVPIEIEPALQFKV